jgi:hypothetical protein
VFGHVEPDRLHVRVGDGRQITFYRVNFPGTGDCETRDERPADTAIGAGTNTTEPAIRIFSPGWAARVLRIYGQGFIPTGADSDSSVDPVRHADGGRHPRLLRAETKAWMASLRSP